MLLVYDFIMTVGNGQMERGTFLLYKYCPHKCHSLPTILLISHNPLYMLLVYRLIMATVNSMDG